MQVSFATEPGGAGTPNEDFVAATGDLVVVLDGLTVPAGVRTGCVHGTRWYVRQLATRLLAVLSGSTMALADGLAEAIAEVAGLHAVSCDLTDPGTPSAAVAVVREGRDSLDYLVLADAGVVVDDGGDVTVAVDRRVDQVAAGHAARARAPAGHCGHRQEATAALVAEQLRFRNRPGGYWIAGASPHAAAEALIGVVPRARLRRVALLSDGASRYTDTFALGDWLDLLDVVTSDGPGGLIGRVRAAEERDPAGQQWPRFKRSDDATVALCTWP